MRNQQNYFKRLESFQNYFKHYPKSKLKDLCAYFHELPYGTISATLSFMYQSGHLTKNDNSEYSLPAVVCSAKQIAVDIAKMQKAKKVLDQSKETNQQLGFFLTPKLSSTQKQIDEAISLLKSHGYKILAKKTEYSEI
jgi:hypothetical protein